MLKRTILATAVAGALAVGVLAQESATLVMKSGEKVTGQLVDMGAAGFTVKVDGQDKTIAKNDVAVIDFSGSGNVSDEQWSKIGSGPAVVLRSGETVKGQLYDIGGTTPLRITLKTDSGERNLTSQEVGSIVLAKPSGAVATSGTAATAGVPEGEGIAVAANQQWTPTGLTVRKGDRISFKATGKAQLSQDASFVASPHGVEDQRKSAQAPLPGNFVGALIGRVGNSEPFPVGGDQVITMPADGQLFLGINDDQVSDNQGGFRVQISRQGRR